MRLFTNFGFMLLLAPSAVLGTLPAAAAEAQAPIPAALQSCAGLFDPVGVPSGEDGADDASYAFASRTFQPQAATPLFIYKCYGGFAVGMNSATRVPDWSAENITLETSQGSATRSNQFRNETDPEGYSSLDKEFNGTGFDRGHQTPAGDFNGNQDFKDKTFFMSNMGPQYGPCFNRGIWKNLEAAVKQLAKTRGRLIVFTGPIYDGRIKSIADLTDNATVHIAVPDEYFKIIYAPGSNRVTALRIPHKPQCGVDFHTPEFLTSVAAIEEVTGFEFSECLGKSEKSS